jgi:peptidoglycan/LPS O-acetylase OafA/YrhL
VFAPALWPRHAGFVSLSDDSPWYWTYLINFRIAADGWPTFGALGHFWSLAVEEQFYVLWPVVVFLCRRRPLMVFCAVCVGVAIVTRLALHVAGNPTAAFVVAPARLDALGIGAFLALSVRKPGTLARVLRWAKPSAIVSVCGLAMLFIWKRGLPSQDPAVSIVGRTLLALFFAAGLALALPDGPETQARKWLASPALMFFGRYSYGLYVLHHPLLHVKPAALSFDSLPTVLGSHLPGWLLFVGAGIMISIGLALLSWHLWEKRFLELKVRHLPSRERSVSASIA